MCGEEEMTDKVEVDAAAVDAEAEAAEFAAGFDGTPTEKITPAVDETPEEKVAEIPAVKFKQVTEAEWEAMQGVSTQIEKIRADQTAGLDKAFGKVGGIERTLRELQQATPKGYEVEVTDDIVADLKAEYPELGELTLKALKTFATKLKGTAGTPATVDPKEFEQQVQAAVTGRVRALEIEALEEDHPSWREVVGKKDDAENAYRKWLAAQPAEYQTKVNSTESATVIGRSITKFEADAKKAADAAAEAAKKVVPSTRQQRLEQAAGVKGAGGNVPGPTEDDEFLAGFKGA